MEATLTVALSKKLFPQTLDLFDEFTGSAAVACRTLWKSPANACRRMGRGNSANYGPQAAHANRSRPLGKGSRSHDPKTTPVAGPISWERSSAQVALLHREESQTGCGKAGDAWLDGSLQADLKKGTSTTPSGPRQGEIPAGFQSLNSPPTTVPCVRGSQIWATARITERPRRVR